MSSAPRGLAPREGLGSVLMKMGRAGPLLEPCRRQACLGTPIPRTPTMTPLFGRPVRQFNCRTNNARTREAYKPCRITELPGGLYHKQYTCFSYHSAACPRTDMLNSPTFCLSHYLYHSALIAALFNKQCIAFVYFCITFFYKYMFLNDMLHPYTLVRPKHARGFSTPQYGVRNPNTLTSAAP